MVVVSIVLVAATGYGGAWVDALIGVPASVQGTSRDIGPARLVGYWWIVVGAALAVWFTVRGRLGLASIAASPYWLPQYLLMLLLERHDVRATAIGRSTRPTGGFVRRRAEETPATLHDGAPAGGGDPRPS
jgi:hypothetical protein